MNNKKAVTRTRRSNATTIMKGVLAAVIITLLLAAVITALTLNGILDESKLKLSSYGIMLLSVFIGTMVIDRNSETQLMVINAAVGAVYMFLLVAINILFFNGSFKKLWVGLIVMTAAAAVSMLLSVKRQKQKTYRFKRFR